MWSRHYNIHPNPNEIYFKDIVITAGRDIMIIYIYFYHV